MLDGRDYVLPDDVKRLAEPVFGHRLVPTTDARIRDRDADEILREILRSVPVPTELDTRSFLTDTAERRQIALYVAGIVGLFAVAWGEMVVLLWASAIATISIASTLWARSALRGVSVEVAFEPPRAFVGEDVTLRVRITQREAHAAPDRPAARTIPVRPAARGGRRSHGVAGHRRRLSIAGRSEVELRLPVVVTTRGEYWLEGVDVVVSDPFDLAPVKHEATTDRPLLVMPEPRVGVPLRIARRLPFGAPAPSAQLFEDREHFAGVRDYEPGDPMHHVHWRLSAHAGKLQTKRYEPTRSAEVLFALDVSNGEPFWHAVDPDTAEESIGWTAYLARQAIHAGWRTGLVANTHLRRGRGPLACAPRTRWATSPSCSPPWLGCRTNPRANWEPCSARSAGGSSVAPPSIVISPRPGPALSHEMEVLRRRGCDVLHLSPLEAYRKAAS